MTSARPHAIDSLARSVRVLVSLCLPAFAMSACALGVGEPTDDVGRAERPAPLDLVTLDGADDAGPPGDGSTLDVGAERPGVDSAMFDVAPVDTSRVDVAMPACIAGQFRSCYTGPTATLGVGACHQGTNACVGGTWSTSCVGQVTPMPENCMTAADEDCDGVSNNGCMACPGGVCPGMEWTYEAESPANGHTVGRREADGWSANTAADAPGYMVFGPYARDQPAGEYDALFRLMVDNHTADNGVVVRVEINDFDGGAGSCGACVLATRDVRRMEFTSAMTYQDVVLRFRTPGGHRLEFRTNWTDISYVRQDRVTIRRVGP